MEGSSFDVQIVGIVRLGGVDSIVSRVGWADRLHLRKGDGSLTEGRLQRGDLWMVTVETLITVSGNHVGGERFAVTHVLVMMVVIVEVSVVVVVSSVVPGSSAGVQGSVAVQHRFEEGVSRGRGTKSGESILG